jgi:hypothetical protein
VVTAVVSPATIKSVLRSSCTFYPILAKFEFIGWFSWKLPISNFKEIHPMGGVLIHADRRTDERRWRNSSALLVAMQMCLKWDVKSSELVVWFIMVLWLFYIRQRKRKMQLFDCMINFNAANSSSIGGSRFWQWTRWNTCPMPLKHGTTDFEMPIHKNQTVVSYVQRFVCYNICGV